MKKRIPDYQIAGQKPDEYWYSNISIGYTGDNSWKQKIFYKYPSYFFQYLFIRVKHSAPKKYFHKIKSTLVNRRLRETKKEMRKKIFLDSRTLI